MRPPRNYSPERPLGPFRLPETYPEDQDVPFLRLLAGIATVLITAISLLATISLVNDVTHPASACERRAGDYGGFQVVSAHLSWPPPLIRCTVVDTYPTPSAPKPVSAMTANHLLVVLALDLLAGALTGAVVVLAVRTTRRTRTSRVRTSLKL